MWGSFIAPTTPENYQEIKLLRRERMSNTYRTYIYTVSYYGLERGLHNARSAEVNWERSILWIDDSNLRDVIDEQVGLRKSVVNYDLFGCGWVCEETGEVWTFGVMNEKMMEELENQFQELINPEPR